MTTFHSTLRSMLYLAALLPAAVHAAGTAEVQITGTLKPSPCVTAFANNGIFDFGTLYAGSLNRDKDTLLPHLRTQLRIMCPASITFGLQVVDNRVTFLSEGTKMYYGLRPPTGKEVGFYRIDVAGKNLYGDGKPARLLYRDDKEWFAGYSGQPTRNGRIFAWSRSLSSNWPASFKSITMDVEVRPTILPSKFLPLTQDIPLDGSSTFELRYL